MHARTENIRARPSEFTMRGLTKVFTKASDLSLSGGKYASASAVILLCVTPISVLNVPGGVGSWCRRFQVRLLSKSSGVCCKNVCVRAVGDHRSVNITIRVIDACDECRVHSNAKARSGQRGRGNARLDSKSKTIRAFLRRSRHSQPPTWAGQRAGWCVTFTNVAEESGRAWQQEHVSVIPVWASLPSTVTGRLTNSSLFNVSAGTARVSAHRSIPAPRSGWARAESGRAEGGAHVCPSMPWLFGTPNNGM